MGLSEACSDLFLKITGIVPRFYQTLQERLISSLICRIAFIHKTSLRDCVYIPQNRDWLIETRDAD